MPVCSASRARHRHSPPPYRWRSEHADESDHRPSAETDAERREWAMSTESSESYGPHLEGPASEPSRRTFIATTTAVGGAVMAGGLAAALPFGAEEAAAV